ncbi:MAG: hypothetical protein AAFP03_14665 [Cyanobacteria bacterium J06598_3]
MTQNKRRIYPKQGKSRQIGPTGNTTYKQVARPLYYLWARALIAPGLKAKDIQTEEYGYYSPFDFNNQSYFNRCLAADTSWTVVHARNKQFRQIGIASILFFLAVSVLLLSISKWLLLIEIFLCWGWVVREVWMGNEQSKYVSPDGNFSPMMAAVKNTALVSLFPLGALLCMVGLMGASPLSASGSFFVVPIVLLAICGTSAGLARRLRTRAKNPEVVCKVCDRPLAKLTDTQLAVHLTDTEKSTLYTHRSAYEGWHCSTCSPGTVCKPDSVADKSTDLMRANIHLLSFGLPKDKPRYQQKRGPLGYDDSFDSAGSRSGGGSINISFGGGGDSGGSFDGGSSGGGGGGNSW